MDGYTLIKAKFAPNYPVCGGVIIVAVPEGAHPLTIDSLQLGAKMLGAYKAKETLELVGVIGTLLVHRPELLTGLPGRVDCKVIHFENGEH